MCFVFIEEQTATLALCNKLIGSAIFCDMQCKMGPIGCPETSVKNYQYTLRNIAEEREYDILRGGSLKSHKVFVFITDMNSVYCAVRTVFK